MFVGIAALVGAGVAALGGKELEVTSTIGNQADLPAEDGEEVLAAPPAEPGTLDPGAGTVTTVPGTTVPATTVPDPATSTTIAPGSGTPGPFDGEPLVQAFYDAMIVEDCPALVGMTTEFFWNSLASDGSAAGADLHTVCTEAFANGDLTSDIVVEGIALDQQEGGMATYAADLVLDGSLYQEFVNLLFDTGVWKIDFLA